MPRETRVRRGRRRGTELVTRVTKELRDARISAGLAQSEIADAVGLAASNVSRFEAQELDDVGVRRLSEIASVLGLELSVGLHPVGDPVRDKGQLALAARFKAMLSERWRVTSETLLPGQGELRAWDKLLRLVGESPLVRESPVVGESPLIRESRVVGETRPYLVGVDLETRIRDIQALVRRTRLRERDGKVDAILLVVADSATNRRLVDELRGGLGDRYQTSPRDILRGLRSGERLVGSGVVLV